MLWQIPAPVPITTLRGCVQVRPTRGANVRAARVLQNFEDPVRCDAWYSSVHDREVHQSRLLTNLVRAGGRRECMSSVL